ncbi:hypothetical protein [Actinokineospora sp.]|uniref:hypothetical protein n=1 Tax=Actinokineospora sp. TaxID=1872133 RepID=UPI0040384506
MSEQPDVTPAPRERTGEAIQLGIVALRPLTLPDFVSGTVQALRRNAAALLVVGFAVAVAAESLRWLLTTLFVGPLPTKAQIETGLLTWDELRPMLADYGIRSGVAMLFAVLVAAVVNVVVPRAVFGHTTGLRAALGAALPAVPKLLGLLLAEVVIIGGLASVGVLALAAGPVGILLLLPALAGVVYLSMAFAFSASVVVVEDSTVIEALRRSRLLVHTGGGWWRVFGISVLTTVIFGLLALVVSTLFARISGDSLVGAALAAILVGTVLVPANVVIQSLLYVDHRSRREGIDGLWRVAG